MSNHDHTMLDPKQIRASKDAYQHLYDQLEFGRFTSVKSGAAPSLHQKIQAVPGQREYIIPAGSFTVGDRSLMVFVNGQLMNEGADNDYIEVNSTTIEFTFNDLTENDMIIFRVAGGTSGPSLHQDVKAEAGQTVFTLSTSYTVGNRSLVVFINGAYQTLTVDYVETDPLTVTFLVPLEKDDLVTFRVEGLPTVTTKYENSTTTSTYDNEGRIVHREVDGDTRIVYEYEYGTDGLPSRMIVRQGGFIATTTYTWENGVPVSQTQTVREGS